MLALALDRASTSGRWTDVDGRLRIPRSIISASEINDYLGQELPGWQSLGLEPSRRYAMLRPAEELARAADSFHGLPLLDRHLPVSAQSPQTDNVIGTVMNATFEAPHLLAELVIWSAPAIKRIEAQEARKAGMGLSAGYRFSPVMQPGVFKGQSFDGFMSNLIGNHVAMVDSPRVTNAFVGDAAPHTTFARASRLAPGLAKVTIGTIGYIV
jgi:uncharacterized protein